MVEFSDLVHFLAVADSGSVRRASQALIISQPAVSRRIHNLERSLGLQLFRRTRTGMVLTREGERLQVMARDLSNRFTACQDVMAAIRTEKFNFTLVCPEITANHFIVPFLAAGAPVARIHPAPPAAVYRELENGADLAINTAEVPEHLDCWELCSTPILVACPPQTKWRTSGDDLELSELSGEVFFMPGYGSAVETALRRAASGEEIDLGQAVIATNGLVAQAMAASGRGAAVVTERADYGMRQLRLTHHGQPMWITFWAAWDPTHYAATEIAVLARELTAWFRERLPDV